MTDREALVLLNMVEGVGPRLILKIKECFPRFMDVFSAPAKDLVALLGVRNEVAEKILKAPTGKSLGQELDFVAKEKIKILTLLDAEYPFLLQKIYDPPPVLYLKGHGDLNRSAIAIVGARSSTHYGNQTAYRLGSQLAASGLVVVSGLARGVDTHAHLGTLAVKGVTFGVMGCGFRYFYPRENKKMAHEICEKGMILSEFPTQVPPLSQNFPRRNRTISGLTLGVVVVEAAKRSGSLITANFALEHGRAVFAVPGRVDTPTARGALGLLRDGAKLVETVEDILEELQLQISVSGSALPVMRNPISESHDTERATGNHEPENSLLNVLGVDPMSVDEVSRLARMDTPQVLSALFDLELKHLVKQLPGKYYVRA